MPSPDAVLKLKMHVNLHAQGFLSIMLLHYRASAYRTRVSRFSWTSNFQLFVRVRMLLIYQNMRESKGSRPPPPAKFK